MRMMFSVVVMLGILLVGPMLLPGPDGEPIMTPDDWIPHTLIATLMGGADKVSDIVEDGVGGVEAMGSAVGAGSEIYRWRDKNGVLHFSDAPIEGAQAIAVPHDALAIPSDHFVEGPLGVPVTDRTPPPTGRSVLLRDRDQAVNGGVGVKDVDAELRALGTGDFSNAGELLKNLPQILEQAVKANNGVRGEMPAGQ